MDDSKMLREAKKDLVGQLDQALDRDMVMDRILKDDKRTAKVIQRGYGDKMQRTGA